MKNLVTKYLAALACFLSIAGVSFASSSMFLPKKALIEKYKKFATNREKKAALHVPDTYADFSGHWIGSCEDERTADLTISQSPEVLSIKSEEDGDTEMVSYAFDGISSQEVLVSEALLKSIDHLRWSSNGQELIFSKNHYIALNSFLNIRGVDSDIRHETWSIVNGQLLIDYSISYFFDGIFNDKESGHCVYTKTAG